MVTHRESRGSVRPRGRLPRQAAFTLVELLVVLAILALLLTIASPRYIHHVDRARETTLRAQLRVMRESIDKFEGDRGHLPATLQELVDRNYLKSLPLDPITERTDTWITVSQEEFDAARRLLAESRPGSDSPSQAPSTAPPSAPAGSAAGAGASSVADVHSGAQGNASDGTPYRDW